MAIKTRYHVKNRNGDYEVIHFETTADQVVTSEELQFITAQEKEMIYASNKPKNHVHNQLSASDEWVIAHNLDKYPSVSITDSAGSIVIGDVIYVDNNNVRIKFTSGFAGTAYLN